jgi:CRP-like cAMP-binding protein
VVEAEGGDTIVEQWEASKDFYVVLAGTVDVLVDGERIRELVAGEFFGELGALDWGGGFGYPRLATVVAASAVRLLRVPGDVLNELVRSNSDVERAIGHAVRERMRVANR